MLWMRRQSPIEGEDEDEDDERSFGRRLRNNLDIPTIDRFEGGMFSLERGEPVDGLMGETYHIDRPGVPIFRGKCGKALYDVRPVLAPNFVPTGRGVATAAAERARGSDDDHADVEYISRVCAQRLDDGGLRQRSRVRREEDG